MSWAPAVLNCEVVKGLKVYYLLLSCVSTPVSTSLQACPVHKAKVLGFSKCTVSASAFKKWQKHLRSTVNRLHYDKNALSLCAITMSQYFPSLPSYLISTSV